MDSPLAVAVRQALEPFKRELILAKQQIEALRQYAKKPKSPLEEIDSIAGRRLFYTLSGTQTFTSAQDGQKGQPIPFLVSQDGPFIMTHYPLAMWRPSSPSTATNFGAWRPVSTWPLPDQVLDTDVVDLSYEFADSGSQRNFQNLPVPAGLLSSPDNMIPLPVPTLFTPNTTIQFIPTYENILFNTGGTPTTGGTLVIALPGYRIVNL